MNNKTTTITIPVLHTDILTEEKVKQFFFAMRDSNVDWKKETPIKVWCEGFTNAAMHLIEYLIEKQGLIFDFDMPTGGFILSKKVN